MMESNPASPGPQENRKSKSPRIALITLIITLIGGAFGFGYQFGNNRYDERKNTLEKINEKYEDTVADQKKTIKRLDDGLEACESKLEENEEGKAIAKKPQKRKKRKKQSELYSGEELPPEPSIPEELNDDPLVVQINKLRAEKKDLEQKLKFVTSEKADLKRKVRAYVNSMASIVDELEILKDALKTHNGRERTAISEQIEKLLEQARASKIAFEESGDDKKFEEEVEKQRKLKDEHEKRLQKTNDSLNRVLDNAALKKAEDLFEEAQEQIKELDRIKVIVGYNRTHKCNFVRKIITNLQEAKKLGKDCSLQIRSIREEHEDCFK